MFISVSCLPHHRHRNQNRVAIGDINNKAFGNKIAHWLRDRRNVLSFRSFLKRFIQRRLVHGQPVTGKAIRTRVVKPGDNHMSADNSHPSTKFAMWGRKRTSQEKKAYIPPHGYKVPGTGGEGGAVPPGLWGREFPLLINQLRAKSNGPANVEGIGNNIPDNTCINTEMKEKESNKAQNAKLEI